MDRVQPRLERTRVPPLGTPGRRARLRGRVINQVVVADATPLEGVDEAEPVARLVDRRLAQAEVDHRAPRHRGRQDGAAVAVEVLGALGRVGRVVAVPEVAVEVLDVVDVEGAVAARAQRALHAHLVPGPGPLGVDGLGGAPEVEGYAVRQVRFEEDGELPVEGADLDSWVSFFRRR